MSGHYERTHLRKPTPGRLYAEWKDSPVCPAGHDLTEPGTKVYVSGKLHCVACRKVAATPLELVEGLRIGLPSTEILDEAVCTPADAWLFEPITKVSSEYGTGESQGQARIRQAQAIEICQGCPVKDLCYRDALKYRRVGVYGGVAMSVRFHRALRERLAALVQGAA